MSGQVKCFKREYNYLSFVHCATINMLIYESVGGCGKGTNYTNCANCTNDKPQTQANTKKNTKTRLEQNQGKNTRGANRMVPNPAQTRANRNKQGKTILTISLSRIVF